MSFTQHQSADLTGVKRLFLRKIADGTLTVSDLKNLAEQAGEAALQGKASVEITSLSADGSASSGVVVMSANDLLVLTMDLLDVIDPVDSTVAPRNIFVKADFSRSRGPFDLNPFRWL
jgi:hypothetical protein